MKPIQRLRDDPELWWQGTRIEKRQAEEDIPNEIVEKLTEHTNVEPA